MINNVSSGLVVQNTNESASVMSPWNATTTKEQILIQSASLQNQERAKQVKNIKISNYFTKNNEDNKDK